MTTLYLCGAGNGEGVRLALRVAEARERWHRIVLLDDDLATHGTQRLGVPVVGGFELLRLADPSTDEVVNLVTRTTAGRARARERIAAFGVPFTSLVHPGIDLLGAELADEVTLYANCCIGAGSHVARSCVVLFGAVVGHGAQLGEGCVIAPNAVVNARVSLGERVYVGANASILPDVSIGAGATIAANTLVLGDVPAGATALGVPATLAQVPSGDAGDDRAPSGPSPDCAGGQPDPLHLEAEIARAVGQLLGVAEVPRTANFFDIGGTSLAAVQLSQQLHDRLGLPARSLDVFQFPSVAALVRHFAGPLHVSPAVEAAQLRAALRRTPVRR